MMECYDAKVQEDSRYRQNEGASIFLSAFERDI